jgi:predicted Rossmann-fold nucleotide-binding protein
VAFPGGAGTLAEVALCWNLLQADPEPNRPLVVVGERWGRAFDHLRELLVVVDPADHDLIRRAPTVERAVELLLDG